MGDKKKKRRQMERLEEIAQELEEREFALSREVEYLAQQKRELEAREQELAKASEALPLHNVPMSLAPQEEPVYRERPLSPQPVVESGNRSAQPPAKVVAEINGIVKSVFWDYSSNVRQVSSQISTVTAAMMCAAVTSVLENRNFDMKEVFVREMERIMDEGDFVKTMQAPPATRSHSRETSAMQAVAGLAKEKAKPQVAAKPEPTAEILLQPELDMPDADEEAFQPLKPAKSLAALPTKPQDDVLRISSVMEFQKLGDKGFRNDDSIVRVQLPEGIQYIPGNFFYGCNNLQEIWLPDSLLEIGASSFYGCTALKAVHIGEKSALREIGEYAFALCESLPSFTIPARVETLGTSVFRFCSSLETLKFAKDSKLKVIGSHLLQNCTALAKLHLPSSVTVIPTSMCYGCLKLRKVVAGGVHTIEDYAFFGNENLQSVHISFKKIIAAQAFEGCDPAVVIEYKSQ